MATITVSPGGFVFMDPSDQRVIVFDFDSVNLAPGVELTNAATDYGITVAALTQGAALLAFDNAGLLTGNRKVQARFLATTGTPGAKYRVSVKATTNETPVQEKEYSIFIKIEDR